MLRPEYLSINGSTSDGLCAALALPGAGVWVILTQSRGLQNAMVTTKDGRTFKGLDANSNWLSSFTIHYATLSVQMDLGKLPSERSSTVP